MAKKKAQLFKANHIIGPLHITFFTKHLGAILISDTIVSFSGKQFAVGQTISKDQAATLNNAVSNVTPADKDWEDGSCPDPPGNCVDCIPGWDGNSNPKHLCARQVANNGS